MDLKIYRTPLAGRPQSFEVADIFGNFSHLLNNLGSGQAKVVRDIVNCRTQVLGGHLNKCDKCSFEEQSYNSCRNRHCPKCQFLTKARWIEDRMAELLPVGYFHVVFTIPHELKPIALCNKKIVYNILFRAMSETLIEVGERRLKAKLGFSAVLHTWGQNLMDHPHIHAIVPGGGLSTEGGRWISAKRKYLLPLKILSPVFRGKFLNYLEESFEELSFPGQTQKYQDKKNFKHLLIEAASKKWVVYAKEPFAGPKQVIDYLGNYTHRIAISNRRIIKVENNQVTFRYRDRTQGNINKIMVLEVKEFMRRFLLHVLPDKFVRIRHFGFLGNRFKKENIDKARKLLNAKKIEKIKDKSWQETLLRLTGHDATSCSHCHQGKMIRVKILPSMLTSRKPRPWDSS